MSRDLLHDLTEAEERLGDVIESLHLVAARMGKGLAATRLRLVLDGLHEDRRGLRNAINLARGLAGPVTDIGAVTNIGRVTRAEPDGPQAA